MEWKPWIEDVLQTYASVFNICLIESEDDLNKLHKHKIDFGGTGNPIYEFLRSSEYAVIEFNANDRNGSGDQVRMIMLMLLSVSQAARFIVKSSSLSKKPVYVEKCYSNYSVSGYIRQMLDGLQKDSRYLETIENKIYQFIRPNGHDDWMKMKCHDFVKKMNRLYTKKLT